MENSRPKIDKKYIKEERERDARFVQKAVALENGRLDVSDLRGQRDKLTLGVTNDLVLPWRLT